jgi:hypothetical protein
MTTADADFELQARGVFDALIRSVGVLSREFQIVGDAFERFVSDYGVAPSLVIARTDSAVYVFDVRA